MEASVTKKYLYEVLNRIVDDCKNNKCSAVEALALVKSNIHDMTPDSAQLICIEIRSRRRQKQQDFMQVLLGNFL